MAGVEQEVAANKPNKGGGTAGCDEEVDHVAEYMEVCGCAAAAC